MDRSQYRQFQRGIADGYNQGIKRYGRNQYPMTKSYNPGLALKTAYIIFNAVKTEMVYLTQLKAAVSNLRQIMGWMKDGTLTKQAFSQAVTAFDNLYNNAPDTISNQANNGLKTAYKQLKDAETAWPRKEGGATNPNFFQLKDDTKEKVHDLVTQALAIAGKSQDDIEAQSKIVTGHLQNQAALYKELNELEPIVDKLKTTLNPAPGAPLERIEASIVHDIVDRLERIVGNPALPPQYVGSLNSILAALKPRTEGGGFLGRFILEKYYQWANGNRAEIEATLRNVVSEYSKIMKSVKQRKT